MTKIVIITILIFISSSFADETDLFSEEAPKELVAKITDFPGWSFCMAYNYRDSNETDRRPSPFEDKSIPYIPQQSLVNKYSMLDTAGLISRTVSQARINKENATTIFNKALKGKGEYPVYDCYDPHHLIVFYGYSGEPVGCIEVCFTCNTIKAYIKKDQTSSVKRVYPLSKPDFLSIAIILDKAEVSMSPFKSLVEYKKSLQTKE